MESQSPAIRWLHLSDFHQGAETQSQSWLWPSARDAFLEDLERQVEDRGGIDLVFFTGDLTQSAQPEQFKRLTETLHELFEALRRWGSSPVLLPVPGNHDLSRPPVSDELDVLCSWVQQPSRIQNRFWQEPDGRYRKLVREAFASYYGWLAEWNKSHPPPKNLSVKEGLLAGDFSASFVKQDEGKGEISLLLVGLNSAFLQLSEGDYKAKLEVHPRQFQAVLPPGWKKQHDAALLLTHHPPSWLHSDALEWYRGEIANPDLIAAHLFGHMHEPTYHGISEGGAAARYAVQAASLFSNEPLGPSGVRSRIHGYSIGELSLSGEKEGQIRIWPRLAVKRSSGVYEFDSDIQTSRGRDQSLRTAHRFPRLRALGTAGARPKPGTTAESDPVYVRRPQLERPLREYLERRAPLPVVLSGPPHCGRRTLLRRVLAEFKQEEARGGREVSVAWLDFADLPCSRREDLDLLLLGMASELGNKLFGPNKTRQLFDGHRQIHGHTSGLTWLLKEDVLPRTQGTLVLAMLSFERMAAGPLRDEILGMLRSWLDRTQAESIEGGDARWQRLRLVMVASGIDYYSIYGSSFFGHTNIVRFRDLSREQIRELAGSCGLSPVPTEAQLEIIRAQIGGHPALWRRVLEDGKVEGVLHTDQARLLQLGASLMGPVVAWLEQWPEGLKAVRGLMADPGASVPAKLAARLQDMGVIRSEGSGYVLCHPLLAEYLRQ